MKNLGKETPNESISLQIIEDTFNMEEERMETHSPTSGEGDNILAGKPDQTRMKAGNEESNHLELLDDFS